jgi:hypothetical protein
MSMKEAEAVQENFDLVVDDDLDPTLDVDGDVDFDSTVDLAP